jgi:hypothetical protein
MGDEEPRVWRLRHGATLVGEIEITDGDFPWLSGTFTAQDGFAPYRQLFVRELAMLNRLLEDEDRADYTEWDALIERINRELTLYAPDDVAVAEFLLHIDGDQAWFR